VWTEAHRRGFAIGDLTEWMARRPAELVGLASRKGEIAPGRDADLVVFDPDSTLAVDPTTLHHRHRATPYEGRVLMGRVDTTYLRGRLVYRSNGFAEPLRGQPLWNPKVRSGVKEP
jgi:allantoinase